ncbi:glycerophosphodiester phosphodiesterase family protein [Ornithinimicrobium sp. W1665]|uniref:glycerophosphodiester phosphodiesterase family protein n=1 Tax=Ornithinimicrobium sp. W1665 TaxID=3416666 RepID=UPI003CF7A7DF
MRPDRPVVIGHRGASGYRPEHTLGSYELAARMGADHLEPDLVVTRDGVLVARHESDITFTTDVARHRELSHRRTSKVIDGVERTGWFVEDLTLAELRTLRAVERLPHLRPGSAAHDRQEQVPTLEEVLQLRERLCAELDRDIGVYPETKHPSHFAGLGLPLEEPLVDLLTRYGLNRTDAPVFVQSFELGSLVRMRTGLGLRARTVFLITEPQGYAVTPTSAPHPSPEGGTEDSGAAAEALVETLARAGIDGLGPHLTMVLAPGDGGGLVDTGLVGRAHAAGLVVHPWTFRAENAFLLPPFRSGDDPAAHGDLAGQVRAFVEAGVDGIFVDHVDVAVGALGRPPAPRRARGDRPVTASSGTISG